MTRPLPVPYTADEAAAILRVEPYTVHQLCKSGVIKAKKPGKRYLISPDALQAYIDGSNSQDVA